MRRPAGAGSSAAVLGGGVERAVERREVDARVRDALAEPLFDAADLALPRQEGEDRAGVALERDHHRIAHLILDARAGRAAEIARLDGEAPPLARDHRRAAEKVRHARRLERRRHDEEPQVLAQAAATVERERQPEVGVERALVELVEQHCRDAVERRIGEDHAREHAFGHDLDTALRSDLRGEAGPQANRLAEALAEEVRHAACCGAGGEAARLEDQDLPARDPRLIEEGERHARRLAGPRRRDEDSGAGFRQCPAHVAQDLVDRQRLIVIIGGGKPNSDYAEV